MKQKTKAEMETILSKYANYSGTKKAFCKEYGIKGHTLYYWQRKLSSPSPKQSSDFIKLEIADGVATEGISIYYPILSICTLPNAYFIPKFLAWPQMGKHLPFFVKCSMYLLHSTY